ncbi:MAG TPA: magnesium transporter MgtE, partial [Planctomycetales bacterium]|nr:magnesium transporter MgtE [Planctomycetales bacterium]
MPLSAISLSDPIRDHLRRDFTRLTADWTVGEALAWLRQHPPAGKIAYFYVLDRADRLQGVASTRGLLLSPLDRPLAEVMIRTVDTLSAEATVGEALAQFRGRRLLAFPVVDGAGVLLGVVDMELWTSEVHQVDDATVRDDLFQQIGVHTADADLPSAWSAFGKRFPWLGCNLAAGLLAAFLSGVFKGVLQGAVELAFFIPLVLNLAESVSSQSVSLSLQMLHGPAPTWRSMLSRLYRETATGAMLGLAAGALVALTALAWLKRPGVPFALLGGIVGGVTGSAILGMTLPIVLRLLRLDPRVAAGP